jgi:hypothetical protein
MIRQRKIQSVLTIAMMLSLAAANGPLMGQDDQAAETQRRADDLRGRLRVLEDQLQLIERERQALDDRSRKLQSSQAEMLEKRSKMLDELEHLGISHASYSEVMRLLQSQRVQLTIDLAGLEARRDAIKETRGKPSDDFDPGRAEILGRLSKLVDLQRTRLNEAQALHQHASISAAELRDTEKQLLEAEIRLAEFSNPFQPAEQQKFHDHLMNVELERAEKMARLQKIEELLKQFSQARQVIDALSWLERQTSDAQSSHVDVEADIHRHEADIDATLQMIRNIQVQIERADSKAANQDKE